jgi:hypothetical protein
VERTSRPTGTREEAAGDEPSAAEEEETEAQADDDRRQEPFEATIVKLDPQAAEALSRLAGL